MKSKLSILLLLLLSITICLCGCVESVENPTEKPAGSSGSTAGSSAPSDPAGSLGDSSDPSASKGPEYPTLLGFTSQYNLNTSGMKPVTSDTKLIQEIYTAAEDVTERFGADSEQSRRYNSDFFREKTLVVLFYCQESFWQVYHAAKEVVALEDGSYQIQVERFYPEYGSSAVGHGTLYLEIDGKLPADAVIDVQTDTIILPSEEWQDRYGSFVNQ